MALSRSEKSREGLRVGWMALALALAAFLGASLGLVWQSSGLGKDDDEAQAESGDADDEGASEGETEDAPRTPPTSG